MTEHEMNLDAKRLRKFGRTIAGWLTGHTQFKKRKDVYVAMAKTINSKSCSSEDSYLVITDGIYFDVLMSSFEFNRNRYDSLEYTWLIQHALNSIDSKKDYKGFYIIK